MKYKVRAIKEIRYIDTYYVEAKSKDEAKDIVYENINDFDESEDYDCTYWEIIDIDEINK